jgi:hypothetical protein
MLIMVTFPYILISDGSVRNNVCSVSLLLFLQNENLGQEVQMIHNFSRLSFPKFETERQRAEYISRSWPHGMILLKKKKKTRSYLKTRCKKRYNTVSIMPRTEGK